MRSYLLGIELSVATADPYFRTTTRHLAQFIAGWNRHLHARGEMKAEYPACDKEILEPIEAVAHAVCARDGIETPD